MKPDIKNHNKNGNSLNVGTGGRSKDRNQKSKSRIGYTKIRCYTFHEEAHIWRNSPKRNEVQQTNGDTNGDVAVAKNGYES